VVRVRTSGTGEPLHPIGAERWLTIHDELLRGLAHAISNRMATFAAAAEELDARVAPNPRCIDGIRSDTDRLEGLLQLLRQLPRRAGAALEPMLLTDAVEQARRLAEEHPAMRGRSIVLELQGDVLPVRAEPSAVAHASTVALLAAARLGDGAIVVTLRVDGDHVELKARPEYRQANVDVDDDLHAIDWLVAPSNGRVHPDPDACAFQLLTLQAARRHMV